MNDFALKVLTAPLGKTYLFSTGQAGYIIKSTNGQLLAIDLYLSECVERVEGNVGFKRLLPKILSPSELKFDVVITTHGHKDHFDIDSVPEMMSNLKTKLFASVDCKILIDGLGIPERNIMYVKPGETYAVGDFIIDFVSCDHGTAAPDAVGVVVTVDGKKIYETGDTCLRLDRAEEYKEKGPFHVMIAPINGAFGNLDEENCVKLARAIKPKVLIPCHYGMFASHGGSPGKFYNLMKNSPGEFLLMAQGEEYVIE